jgi:hypothetical protein
VIINPKSLLEFCSPQQLADIFPQPVDASGLHLGEAVLRAVAIGQFLVCAEVVPASNAMITKDGIMFESISRISSEQAASTTSRTFMSRVATSQQFARFSTDGGMLWDYPQLVLWLIQAAHAAVTYAALGAIPREFIGFDFIKLSPIAQTSPEGGALRAQLLAGSFGSLGCPLTAFAVRGTIASPNEFFDAIRNVGHTFSLLLGDDEHSVAWCPLMDGIVQSLVNSSAAQRSVHFLVFSFNLCMQQWGLTVQKLNMYQGIPFRVLDQRMAKSLLFQMVSEIRLKALDQQQFEAASAVTTTFPAPIINVFTEYAKRRDDRSMASASGDALGSTLPAGDSSSLGRAMCFTHLEFLLQLSQQECARQVCNYPHPSLGEVKRQKNSILEIPHLRPSIRTALEGL